jgi:hypothetical protein
LEVFTAVSMKNAVFWDVTPRTDVSEEPIAFIMRMTRIIVLPFIITANVVPRSLILVTLMMEEIRSFETSVLTTATWRNIPEGGILHVSWLMIIKIKYPPYTGSLLR